MSNSSLNGELGTREGASVGFILLLILLSSSVLGEHLAAAENFWEKRMFAPLSLQEADLARKKAEDILMTDRTLVRIEYARLYDKHELALKLAAGLKGLPLRPLTLRIGGIPRMTITTNRLLRLGSGVIQWSGRVEGDQYSLVEILVKENDPNRGGKLVLLGTVVADGRKFGIRPEDNGILAIEEYDMRNFPAEGHPVSNKEKVSRRWVPEGQSAIPFRRTWPDRFPPDLLPTDFGDLIYDRVFGYSVPYPEVFAWRAYLSCQVDVLVAYTEEVRRQIEQELSGFYTIYERLKIMIDVINDTYRNSGIFHRLRLVNEPGESYETCLTESGTTQCYQEAGDLQSDLTNLNDAKPQNPSQPTPGQNAYPLKVVHRWRDALGADLVSLLVNDKGDPPLCGLSDPLTDVSFADNLGEYDPAFSESAFSVVPWECAKKWFSLAHEFGHLGGASHDRGYLSANTGDNGFLADTRFNYGYASAGLLKVDAWMTIMAKNLESDMECPLGAVCCRSCERRAIWSGLVGIHDREPPPPKLGDGVPATRERSTDNRWELSRSAYTLANFRSPRVRFDACFPTMVSVE